MRAIIGPSKKFYYKSQPGGEELNETNGQGSMVQEDLGSNPSPSNFFLGHKVVRRRKMELVMKMAISRVSM